jgi:hypothetical protein
MNDLQALIDRLNASFRLSDARASKLHRANMAQAYDRMMAGEDFRGATGDLSILSQEEDAFRAELHSIDDDLPAQIAIVNEALDGWFGRGMLPAPYYAWRIAVILAKQKRLDEERDFLAAWCRHFGHRVGARFEALADRARKRGVLF